MNQRNEIIIIGGGVIGACIAYYLSKEKHEVALLEKNQICSGSSHGNAGLISCANPIPMAEPGVIKKGLRWLLDAEGPFYIKPRLDLELLRLTDWHTDDLFAGVPIASVLFPRLLLFDEVDDGLDLTTTYWYRARAINDVGTSDWSDEDKTLVLAGDVRQGMTMEQVRTAWGDPAQVGGLEHPEHVNART